MKAVILLVVVLISAEAKIRSKALTDEQQTRVIEACSRETGVDPMIVINPPKEKIDDLKKYFLCAFKKTGLTNEAGRLQLQVVRAHLVAEAKDEKVADKLMERCAVQKETPGDTVYDFTQCVRNVIRYMMVGPWFDDDI